MKKSNFKWLVVLCTILGFTTFANAQIFDSKIHCYRASIDPYDGKEITIVIFNGNLLYSWGVSINPGQPFNPFDNPKWFVIRAPEIGNEGRYEYTDSQGNVTYRKREFTYTYSVNLLSRYWVGNGKSGYEYELDPTALKKGELKWATTSTRDNIPPKLTYSNSMF